MKYLITGLGNIGDKYQNTRHNIGFKILDAFAAASGFGFESRRYGDVAQFKHKSHILTFLKPSTYMNLSGNAVRYWLNKEKIQTENLLVIVDDLALPLGKIRIRPSGSDGGHNGLLSIIEMLGHQNYPRLRFGIGNNFDQGKQVNYVLGEWNEEEEKILKDRILLCNNAILSFVNVGTEKTMNLFNNK
ncbi:MAG: aminoacyl-tRNA hydrolase [Bacteroidales bacterium]|nr:aminoacyl-tRNA hydrolase [Bacteroidales bacterium]